jgi:hypothetical protein
VSSRHGRPVTVRDLLSGISTRVARGAWFAIVFPIRDPNTVPKWRLQALDAHGRVVAQEPHAG